MKTKYEVGGGCVLCLTCIYSCPVRAINIIEDVSAVIDKEKCVGCGRCYENCQAEVIRPVKVD